jgi:hypothetical protein
VKLEPVLSWPGVKTGRYIRQRPEADGDSTAAWGSGRSGAFTARLGEGPRAIAEPEEGPLAAGAVIERYIVIEHVGAGGLGDVYAAYDPELDRKVAIKLLKPMARRQIEPGLGDPTSRLLREAQAMARLRHPNVVTVYDVGTTAGQIFLAMEFVHGLTLSKWIGAKPRAWTEVRDAMSQAGRGLAHAHEANIVHRDFKPQNVIVGSDGRVAVLDFGLARAVEQGEGTSHEPLETEGATSLLDQEMTDAGVVMGTPSYMAPELFDGRGGSALTDQFAFCVTLYEMLHGERPFRSASLGEHLHKVREGKVPPFRPNRDVPMWLHRVAVRGLSPQPEVRFANMQSLIEAMHLDRARRRRRWLGVAFGIPLLSATVAVGALALRPEPTQAEVDLTEQLVTDARAAAAKGYFVHPPVEDPLYPTAYGKVLELEGMQGSIAAQAEGAATLLRDEMASTLVRLGDTYYDKPGGPPFAADFYAMALVFDPDNDRAAARATVTPGELAALRSKAESGSFTETELVAAEPLTVLADTDEKARSNKVAKMRRRKVAASATTQARLERLLGSEGPPKVAAGMNPPRSVAEVEAPPRAMPPVDEADAPVRAEKGASEGSVPRDPKLARTEANAGRKAFGAGKFDDAERHYHRALQHDRRCLPALEGLTDLHFERSQYEKAVGFARRATALAPRKSSLQIKLGDAYFKVFRYTEARRAYEKARALGSKVAKNRLERLSRKVAG